MEPTPHSAPAVALQAGPRSLSLRQPTYVAIGLIMTGIAFTLSWVGLLGYWAVRLVWELATLV